MLHDGSNSGRKSLGSIARAAGNLSALAGFDDIIAADDFGPLPKGAYTCLAIDGKLGTTKRGTESYTITFRIIEGEFTGRQLWWNKYFSDAAKPYTKRDLAKIGLDSAEKLQRPFPKDRLVCKVTATLRTDDNGIERNEIKLVELLRIQEPPVNPFALTATTDTDFPVMENGGVS